MTVVGAPRVAQLDPVFAPLDPGVTLIEASAGTGKTFSITVFVVRLVLESATDLERILVVTFTNAATDELITRIRSALRTAERTFAGTIDRTNETEIWFRLRDGAQSDGLLEQGLLRLRKALSELDRLAVFTIHGFCRRVLEESALETGTPFGAEFIEAADDLLETMAQDWWRRTFYANPRLAALAVCRCWQPTTFLDAFRASRRHPRTTIEPPALSIEAATAALDAAGSTVLAAWDADRVGRVLDGVKWNRKSPFGSAPRASITGAVAAFRRDELDAIELLGACAEGAIAEHINKRRKNALDPISQDPFFAACGQLAAPVVALEHALRCDFISEVGRTLEIEKRRRQALGFDDLLRRVHAAIEEEGPDGQLATAIRARYDAALIDEFQDTDPFQYPIFDTAFRGRPLFLIGDPKQAIYSFRGADIFAYGAAARGADRRFSLPTNWRSTSVLVDGINALFGRAPRAFLRPADEIGFARMAAARNDPCPMSDTRAPLQWWFVPSEDGQECNKGEARARLERRTALEIVALLEGCQVAEKGGARPVLPSDIAVLVRTHHEAAAVQRALQEARVPSVVASTGDILASAELRELERVLRALAMPRDGDAVRSALGTELWGWSAARIRSLSETHSESEWAALIERLLGERESWIRSGFMRTMQRWMNDEQVAERMLHRPDGQRRMTNLRHAMELLQAVSEEERLSPEGLLSWITRERATRVTDGDRRELRLETDAQAVQIVTIHKAKGLEYGIVFCNCLWNCREQSDDAVSVHENDGIVLDYGSAAMADRRRRAAAEESAEALRLAYVALTRAKWRCYVGWGVINSAAGSALSWLLRHDSTAADDATCEDLFELAREGMQGSMDRWLASLQEFAGQHPTLMECHVLSGLEELRTWTSPGPEFTGQPWPRTFRAHAQLVRLATASFSSLTRLHDPLAEERDIADPGAGEVGDTGEAPTAVPTAETAERDPIFAFAAGRRTGDIFHAIFEHVDFQATDSAETSTLIGEVLARDPLVFRGLDAGTAQQAVAAMVQRTVRAPLPGVAFTLADVARECTLREWPFLLPLSRVTGQGLAAIFEMHGGDPAIRAYGRQLSRLSRHEVRGYLTGVVDIAFTHGSRWYVADWKSNHLGDSPASYDEGTILREMSANHYILQYHLYLLALHRYLAVRQPGYDYDSHIGGAWYAFVRGIDGSPGRGWWHDRPPRALIEALDAALVAPAMRAEAAG